MAYLINNGQMVVDIGKYLVAPPPPSFDDWFLPSKDELNAMYVNLKAASKGDFLSEDYWSSSETNATLAWKQNFLDGSQTGFQSKGGQKRVRPARKFNGGSYSYGDIGPAGGFIFLTGPTNYEAAPADVVGIYFWSTITGTAIGTTGTAIGDGVTNTAAMILQGDTSEAAYVCDNYVV